MKKLLLIVNPIAGKRRAVEYLPKIIKRFENAGFRVESHYTEIDRGAADLVKRYGAGMDYIACAGGDGTLKQAVCGIVDGELDVKLGYIPVGTTNDFAHSLDIPIDALKAVDAIIDGDERRIDVGDFNGVEQFVYVSCFGNFCDVSYKANQKLKNKIGRGAYYLETVKELNKIKGYRVKVECDDGAFVEGNFFYGGVSNSYSVAGFPVLTKAGVEFDDGLHELALIRMPKNPSEFTSIIKSMFVTKDVLNNKYLVVKRGKKFKFYFDEPVHWTLDGESGGKHDFVEITTMKRAVNIMVEDD